MSSLLVLVALVVVIAFYFKNNSTKPVAQSVAPAPPVPPAVQRLDTAALSEFQERARKYEAQSSVQKREIRKLKKDLSGMYDMVKKMSVPREAAPPPRRERVAAPRRYAASAPRRQAPPSRPTSAPTQSQDKTIAALEDRETNQALSSWFGIG